MRRNCTIKQIDTTVRVEPAYTVVHLAAKGVGEGKVQVDELPSQGIGQTASYFRIGTADDRSIRFSFVRSRLTSMLVVGVFIV